MAQKQPKTHGMTTVFKDNGFDLFFFLNLNKVKTLFDDSKTSEQIHYQTILI